MTRMTAAGLALFLPLVLTACAGGEAPASTAAAETTEEATPSAAELEYAAITAGWSDAAFEGCGRVLTETLGTRDLVQGALDGVRDERGLATAEIDDARYWLGLGTEKIAEVRPRLEAGECDGNITLALDEAVQFFVKAGTSAVQAGQIAGS